MGKEVVQRLNKSMRHFSSIKVLKEANKCKLKKKSQPGSGSHLSSQLHGRPNSASPSRPTWPKTQDPIQKHN
jgi:hypothetical protein